MIISCLFNFYVFFFFLFVCFFCFFCFVVVVVLLFYSEVLLWFCYQSKFAEWVSWPRGSLIYLSERGTLFCLCLSIGHQCVSPAVFSLLSEVP